MTPQNLLNRIQNLHKGELLILSKEERVYLKLAHNLDTNIVGKKKTTNLFNSIGFALLMVDLLYAACNDISDIEVLDLGYEILIKHARYKYPVRVFMEYMFYHKFSIIDIGVLRRDSKYWLEYSNSTEKDLSGSSEMKTTGIYRIWNYVWEGDDIK